MEGVKTKADINQAIGFEAQRRGFERKVVKKYAKIKTPSAMRIKKSTKKRKSS